MRKGRERGMKEKKRKDVRMKRNEEMKGEGNERKRKIV